MLFKARTVLKSVLILSLLVVRPAMGDNSCPRPEMGLKRSSVHALANRFTVLGMLPNFCRKDDRRLINEGKKVANSDAALIKLTMQPLDSVYDFARIKTFQILSPQDKELFNKGQKEIEPDLSDEEFYRVYLYAAEQSLRKKGQREAEIQRKLMDLKNHLCAETTLYLLGRRGIKKEAMEVVEERPKPPASQRHLQLEEEMRLLQEKLKRDLGSKDPNPQSEASKLYEPARKVFVSIKELLQTTKLDQPAKPHSSKESQALVPKAIKATKAKAPQRDLPLTKVSTIALATALPGKGPILMGIKRKLLSAALGEKKRPTRPLPPLPPQVKMIEAGVKAEENLRGNPKDMQLIPYNPRIIKVYMTKNPNSLRLALLEKKHKWAQIRVFARKWYWDDMRQDAAVPMQNKKIRQKYLDWRQGEATEAEADEYMRNHSLSKLSLSKADKDLLKRKDLFYSAELYKRFDELMAEYHDMSRSIQERYNTFRYYNRFMFHLLERAYTFNFNQEFMEPASTSSEHYDNFKKNKAVFERYSKGTPMVVPNDLILKKYSERVLEMLSNVYIAKDVYEYRANQVTPLQHLRFSKKSKLNTFGNNAHFNKDERREYNRVFKLRKDNGVFFKDEAYNFYRGQFLGRNQGSPEEYLLDLAQENRFHKYGQVMSRLAMESYRLSRKYAGLRKKKLSEADKEKLKQYVELFDKAQEVYTTGRYGIKKSPSNAAMMAAGSHNLRTVLHNTGIKENSEN